MVANGDSGMFIDATLVITVGPRTSEHKGSTEAMATTARDDGIV